MGEIQYMKMSVCKAPPTSEFQVFQNALCDKSITILEEKINKMNVTDGLDTEYLHLHKRLAEEVKACAGGQADVRKTTLSVLRDQWCSATQSTCDRALISTPEPTRRPTRQPTPSDLTRRRRDTANTAISSQPFLLGEDAEVTDESSEQAKQKAAVLAINTQKAQKFAQGRCDKLTNETVNMDYHFAKQLKGSKALWCQTSKFFNACNTTIVNNKISEKCQMGFHALNFVSMLDFTHLDTSMKTPPVCANQKVILHVEHKFGEDSCRPKDAYKEVLASYRQRLGESFDAAGGDSSQLYPNEIQNQMETDANEPSPTAAPTAAPTRQPTSPTAAPTRQPTSQPTRRPTRSPAKAPTTKEQKRAAMWSKKEIKLKQKWVNRRKRKKGRGGFKTHKRGSKSALSTFESFWDSVNVTDPSNLTSTDGKKLAKLQRSKRLEDSTVYVTSLAAAMTV